MTEVWKTAGLLLLSNVFMTAAWYGHLKERSMALWLAVVSSWGIAFFEYLLQVPANRIGYRVMSAYQLKVLQEAMTLCVFVVFSWVWLGEKMTPRFALSFGLIFLAVLVAFRK